jgi:hypothetical protein
MVNSYIYLTILLVGVSPFWAIFLSSEVKRRRNSPTTHLDGRRNLK